MFHPEVIIAARRKTARLLIKREIFSVDRLLTETIMRKDTFTESSGRLRTLKNRNAPLEGPHVPEIHTTTYSNKPMSRAM